MDLIRNAREIEDTRETRDREKEKNVCPKSAILRYLLCAAEQNEYYTAAAVVVCWSSSSSSSLAFQVSSAYNILGKMQLH